MKRILKKLLLLVTVFVMAGLPFNVSNAASATLCFSDFTLSRLKSIEEGPVYLPFDDFSGTTWVYDIVLNEDDSPETLSVAWVSGEASLKNLYSAERRPDGRWLLTYNEYGGTGTAKFRLTAGLNGQTVEQDFSVTVTEAPVQSKPVQLKETVNVSAGQEVLLSSLGVMSNIDGCDVIYMGEFSTGGTSSVHEEENVDGYRFTLQDDSTFVAAESGQYTIHIMVKPCYNLSKTFLLTVVAGEGKKPENVSLDQSGPVELKVGETLALKAALTPSDATSKLTWKSSKEDVATVDKNGLVTAVSAGTATITVSTDNGKTAEVEIQVTAKSAKPEKISLKQGKKLTMEAGKKLKLTPVLTPASATAKLTWKTTDKSIVKVSKSGVVKALKAGKATVIVVTDNGKSAKIKITVKPKTVKPAKISLKQGKKLTLKVGKKLTLKPILTPAAATAKLTWTTSDEAVVKVSQKGVIKAMKKGKATVTVITDNGKSAKIKITVKGK